MRRGVAVVGCPGALFPGESHFAGYGDFDFGVTFWIQVPLVWFAWLCGFKIQVQDL